MWNLLKDMLPISITSLFKRSEKIVYGHENDFVLPTINTEAKEIIFFDDVKV